MPLYKITGASKTTGAERTVTVEAKHEAGAIALANADGILVTETEMVTAAGTPARAKGKSSPAEPSRARPPAYTAASIASTALFVLAAVSFAVAGWIVFQSMEASSTAGLFAATPFLGSGLTLMTFGCALSLLREIAIHTHPASR